MGCLDNWADLSQQLRPRWRTLAIDLPGHGGTPLENFGAPGAFERLTEALEDLLNGLSIGRVHLLGYSMGGRVALALALRAPERFRSLILEGVSPGLETDGAIRTRHRDEAGWAGALNTDREQFLETWQINPLFIRQAKRNPDGYAQALGHRLKADPGGWAGALVGFGLSRQPNFWPQLPDLDLPTLLVTGKDDLAFTRHARRMVALLPNASHRVVDQAAHGPHLEQPARFSQVVTDFLQIHDP